MPWDVELHKDFEPEFHQLSITVQNSFFARAKILSDKGPTLGRPYVDTLYNKNFNNLKEIRFNSDNGVWRFLFIFTKEQIALILVAGNKKGVDDRIFYENIISIAEDRIENYSEE